MLTMCFMLCDNKFNIIVSAEQVYKTLLTLTLANICKSNRYKQCKNKTVIANCTSLLTVNSDKLPPPSAGSNQHSPRHDTHCSLSTARHTTQQHVSCLQSVAVV